MNEPPSPRTGTGGSWPWRRCAPPTATTTAATRLLDQAEALYRHGFYPDVRPIAAMRARVQIAAGDLASAAGWADDRGVSVEDDPDYLREYEHLTLARLLLAQHRAEQHGDRAAMRPWLRVLGLLDRLHAAAADAGRDGSVLEIRVLQALAHHAHGDLPAALAALSRRLVEAPEPDSYVRLYLDEGAPMLALLHDAAERRRLAVVRSAAKRCGHGPADSSSGRRPVEDAEPPQPLATR